MEEEKRGGVKDDKKQEEVCAKQEKKESMQRQLLLIQNKKELRPKLPIWGRDHGASVCMYPHVSEVSSVCLHALACVCTCA